MHFWGLQERSHFLAWQLLEGTASPALEPLPPSSVPATQHLSGPAFFVTSLSWTTAEVPLRLRIHGIDSAHLDDPACSPHLTLVTSAKSLLSCQVLYPQVPGIRVQTSLGAIALLTIHVNCPRSHFLTL